MKTLFPAASKGSSWDDILARLQGSDERSDIASDRAGKLDSERANLETSLSNSEL